MPYKTAAVANYFLDLASKEGKSVTPMQLLKIIYFAHGWHLGLTGGQPLIDEAVEAWKFGPVVPSLYHEFKDFGMSPITRKAVDYSFGLTFKAVEPELAPNENLAKFLAKVWQVYGRLSGGQLSELTHQENTPWHTTWFKNGGQLIKGMDIPNQLMTEYFKARTTGNPEANTNAAQPSNA